MRKNLQTRNTKIFREAPLGPSWLTLFCWPPMPTIIVSGKGVVGDKNILDIIDAQTRAMEGLDTTAALWSAADKAAEACACELISASRPHFQRKIIRGRRSLDG